MRRLALALQLTRHALSTAGCYPGVSLGLHDLPCCVEPSSGAAGKALYSKLRARGSSAVLREDGMLTRIMEHHPQLEEELEVAFRQEECSVTPNLEAAPCEKQTKADRADAEAEAAAAAAAQRAADALFDTELAARMVRVTSQGEHRLEGNPAEAGPFMPSSTGRRGGQAASDPYAPPYSIYDARRGLEQTLKRMLARAGYYKRDLLDPRSLSLLKPAQLMEVCEDCGIPAPKGTPHAELAQAVANLVAWARQTSSGRRPPAYFTHGPLEQSFDTAQSSEKRAQQASVAGVGTTEEGVEEDEDSGSDPKLLPPLPTMPAVPAEFRRERLVLEARYRQQVLQLIAPPRKISRWLVAARAQDTAVVYPPRNEGRAALVVATAVSQRHAAACVEAVRWQVSEALAGMRAAAAPGSSEEVALSSLKAPTAVGLGIGSDWVALDAGHAEVHVLTAPARAYYQLEFSYEQSSGDHRQAAPGQAPLQRVRSNPLASPLTLDTIQADQAEEPSNTTDEGNAHAQGFQPVLLHGSQARVGRAARVSQGLFPVHASGFEQEGDGGGAGGTGREDGGHNMQGTRLQGSADVPRHAQAWSNEASQPPLSRRAVKVEASSEQTIHPDQAGTVSHGAPGRREHRRPLFEGL